MYLIAHKVRGEIAFDVAIILAEPDSEGEAIWIVSTSGHRAYPFWHEPLALPDLPPMPADLPDHYTPSPTLCAPAPPAPEISLADLGLARPAPTLRRIT